MGQRKKARKAAPGTWLERDMFTSRAFLELSGFAPQLLVLFLAKRDISSEKLVRNKDSITMTYLELENIYNRYESRGLKTTRKDSVSGISRPRIVRALDNLLTHGFIRIVHRGGAFQQDKTVYGLVDDWRLWGPGQKCKTRDPDTRKRGYNGRLGIPKPAYETVPIHTNEIVPMRN